MTTPMIEVASEADILEAWRETAIGDLLRYHCLGGALRPYERAEILIAMCMDHRKSLRIPENFAYVLRTGAGNLRRVEFKVSFAVAVGGVEAIALIAHSDCRMVGLASRRDAFVAGLVEHGGWPRDEAERHFDLHAPSFGIEGAASFVRQEAARLRVRFPKVAVAPLYYTVEDGRLHQLTG